MRGLSNRVAFELWELGLAEGSTILEIGTGAGTESLTHHGKFNIVSIEHQPKWHTGHSKLLEVPLRSFEELDLPKAFYKRFDPIRSEWYDPKILAASLAGIHYDAIVIDGPNGSARRAAMWWYCDKLFRLDVPIVVDDVHRRTDWLVAVNIANKKQIYDFKVAVLPSKMFAVLP